MPGKWPLKNKIQKFSISDVTRLSQPKYNISRWKSVTGSLKQKITTVIQEKKSKNANEKRKNYNFEKQKMSFFLMSQGSLN